MEKSQQKLNNPADEIHPEAIVKSQKPAKLSKARGKCTTMASSSHTKFLRKPRHENNFKEITRNEYCNITESISSSDTFHCIHGPDGKVYTEKGLLKRNILKELDPIPIDRKWNDECPTSYGCEIAEKIEFLVVNGCALQQLDRLQAHLRDFARTSSNGFRVDILKSLTIILDFLMDTVPKVPLLKEELRLLLHNMTKPIILTTSTDVVKYFNVIRHFIGFIGYLLMIVEEDEMFDLIAEAIIWHLSAPDSVRGQRLTVLPLQHTLAAASVLAEPIVRMIPITSSHRFSTFLNISLLLAIDTEENCIKMMEENIIENVFYRFNPYFPERTLPSYDINPADCQDPNVKLGDSSVHLSTTMSLLLVLLKTTKEYVLKNSQVHAILPCPNAYSLRCFIWAYRYECRAREHRHQRITLTVIATVLLKCFGSRLWAFSSWLMPDIMSLSVMTELPPRSDWTRTVNFNAMQQDVLFKKILIYFVVEALKVFPCNKFMVTSRHWLLGLMYLIDPALSSLRARWSPSLFMELQKTAFQALVYSLPLCDCNLVKEYSLIRRLMWYIEWYSESPYEISTLYWCVRVFQVAVFNRDSEARESSISDLFYCHGIIILINLCYTLLNQKLPPVEKSQAVIALCLRLLTNAVHTETQYYSTCCVYPNIKWPISINTLTRKMLNVVLYSLEKQNIISDRWLVSLLNFVWEAVIWNDEYRELFVKNDGMYKLLDLVTMTRPAVQCIALALICDVARAGIAVGHLVSWRARAAASDANPVLVKRGSNISALLAAIFRDECKLSGIGLNEYGVITNLKHPIMTESMRNALHIQQDLHYLKSPRTPVCLVASEMAGSRMSKAFAILHMLSTDLEDKVAIADEAYKLYKNIDLDIADETVLILCSHYLTLKLNDVWTETKLNNSGFVYQDAITLEEFSHIGFGWAKEIKRQQEDVVRRAQKKECNEESSLYAFLDRIRLNTALEALKDIRCAARSTDRHQIINCMLHDAILAHQRCNYYAKKLAAPVLRTYRPTLDDANIIGQNVKISSIQNKHQSVLPSSSPSNQSS